MYIQVTASTGSKSGSALHTQWRTQWCRWLNFRNKSLLVFFIWVLGCFEAPWLPECAWRRVRHRLAACACNLACQQRNIFAPRFWIFLLTLSYKCCIVHPGFFLQALYDFLWIFTFKGSDMPTTYSLERSQIGLWTTWCGIVRQGVSFRWRLHVSCCGRLQWFHSDCALARCFKFPSNSTVRRQTSVQRSEPPFFLDLSCLLRLIISWVLVISHTYKEALWSIVSIINHSFSYVIGKLIERIKDRSLRVLPLCELDAESKASMQ